MENAIDIQNLSVCYGKTEAVSAVSFSVAQGDFLGIIGPNGGGKSTLLKAILGLVPVSDGSIKIFGKSVKKSDCPIGYVPQFSTADRKFPISAFETVLTGRLRAGFSFFKRYSDEDKRIAREQLERVGLTKLADRQISQLSGGEFQRMLIARALTVYPRLLFLDEPTASVDAVSRDAIYELLQELNRDVTIVLVTHDMMAVSAQVKSIACMNGTLVYHGAPELNTNIVQQLYGCPVDLIAHGVPHRVLGKHDHAHNHGGAK